MGKANSRHSRQGMDIDEYQPLARKEELGGSKYHDPSMDAGCRKKLIQKHGT